MLQRLLDTTSLGSGEWLTVMALSLLAPAVLVVDKLISRIGRQRTDVASRQHPVPAPGTAG